MKIYKFNQNTFSIKIMIDMLCKFNIMLTCYIIKIITFTPLTKVFTFNESTFSIISKSSFNHIKVYKLIKMHFQLK